MKKVLLIGEFNDTTKEINDSLAKYCQIQFCVNQPEIVDGMLKLMCPDLLFLSLVGSVNAYDALFPLLLWRAAATPMVVLGPQDAESELSGKGRLSKPTVHFLRHPVPTEQALGLVKELLHLETEAGEGKEEVKAQESQPLKTVLVVDDNPALLRTMQMMLSKKYRVTFATSGTQAIAACAKTKPDVILLDYEMPLCDGKMTLKMLRSEEETRDIPVIFLTGLADASHVRSVLSLRPQGYILKPPNEETIFERLEEVLGNAPAGQT